MKFFLITDDVDTCVGLRLAGVESALVTDKEKANAAFEAVEADDEIGILFVTAGVHALASEQIDALCTKGKPVVMEIPDSSGKNNTHDRITEYIRASVGISV